MTSRLRVRLLLGALLAAACTKAPRQAAPPKMPPNLVPLSSFNQPPDDGPDRDNLANLAYGASILSRTGESSLDFSAVQLIDGDPLSPWLSPLHAPEQSIVVALPSRSRIEQLGARRGASPRSGVKSLRIERSLDGKTFEPYTTLHLAENAQYQIGPVPPAEATYLRLTTAETTGAFSQLNSFVVRGKPLEPMAPRSLDGCWSINRITTASFQQQGNSFSGSIGGLSVDGGTDGRAFRFVWTRGPQFGMGLVTLTPDSRHLTGLQWYEEATPLFLGDSWFGDRVACGAKKAPPQNVFEIFLNRFGRFPLYGLAFDAQAKLLPGSEPALERLAKHLAANPRTLWNLTNHGDARRLETLRAALAQRGVNLANVAFVQAKAPRREAFTEPTRALYDDIDLEIRR